MRIYKSILQKILRIWVQKIFFPKTFLLKNEIRQIIAVLIFVGNLWKIMFWFILA